MKQCNLVSENIYRIQVRRVLEVCCCTVRLYDISDVCLNTTNRGRDKNNVMPFKTFKITPTLNCPDTDRRGRHIFIEIFLLHLHLTSIYCPWLDFYIWDCKSPFGTDLIVSRENCVRPEDSPSWEHFPSFMVVTKRRDCFQHNTQQHILFRELHNTTPLMSGVRNYHCAPHTDSCSIEFLNFDCPWIHNIWRKF